MLYYLDVNSWKLTKTLTTNTQGEIFLVCGIHGMTTKTEKISRENAASCIKE